MSRTAYPPVMTGSGDDGRRRRLRLAVGAVGWLLLGALIVYLAANSTLAALDVAVFLVTAITLVTVVSVLTALQLRDDLMRERMIVPQPGMVDRDHDSLGRPVEPPSPELTGEIVLDTVDGVRRYRRLDR